MASDRESAIRLGWVEADYALTGDEVPTLKADFAWLLAELAAAREKADRLDRLEALRAYYSTEEAEREFVRLQEQVRLLREALETEIKVVCECDGENNGIDAIDVERSPFDYGANAYDGAGNVITDYFDCPCAPLRAALDAAGEQA